jgi:hypothetical protein
MTREEAYRECMADGYSQERIDFYVNIIKGDAEIKGIEPFSGPGWKGLDDYIKRKTQNNG